MNAKSKENLLILMVILLVAFSLEEVSGLPSSGNPPFTKRQDGDWYDSWGIDRNRYHGDDGYMPKLAYETLGNSKELAYSLGGQFKTSYASKVQRAEAILKFVQRWTEYGYDADNVVAPDGTPQKDWAWNADEMAHMFNTATNTVAVGDCEDMAFLCATIYIGAGFDAAMVLAPRDVPNHAALLIWLPEYPNANHYWDIGDGRGKGWIWVEATGEHNPLGWTPPDFNDGYWTPYPLGLIIFNVNYSPQNPQVGDNVVVTVSVIDATTSISQVSLNYSIQGSVYNTLTMAPKDAVYEAIIPKQQEGATVEFYVSATDDEGNAKETDKFSYTVGMEKGFEIPGFLWELIIIGLIIGVVLLAFFAERK